MARSAARLLDAEGLRDAAEAYLGVAEAELVQARQSGDRIKVAEAMAKAAEAKAAAAEAKAAVAEAKTAVAEACLGVAEAELVQARLHSGKCCFPFGPYSSLLCVRPSAASLQPLSHLCNGVCARVHVHFLCHIVSSCLSWLRWVRLARLIAKCCQVSVRLWRCGCGLAVVVHRLFEPPHKFCFNPCTAMYHQCRPPIFPSFIAAVVVCSCVCSGDLPDPTNQPNHPCSLGPL